MKKILFVALLLTLLAGCSSKDYSHILEKTDNSKIVLIKEVEEIKTLNDEKILVFNLTTVKTIRGESEKEFKIGYKVKNDEAKTDEELTTKYEKELKDKVYLINFKDSEVKSDYIILNDEMIELMDYDINLSFDKQNKKLMKIINQFINVKK